MSITYRPPPNPRSTRRDAPQLGLWFVTTPDRARVDTCLQLDGLVDAVIGRSPNVEFPIDDQWLSRKHVRVQSRLGPGGTPEWWALDLGASNGSRINGTALTEHQLLPGDVLRLGGTVLCFGEGAKDEADLGIKGLSTQLHEVRETIAKFGREDVIYVTGEPGTGKEVVAHAIYQASQRSGTLLAINMATVVDTLAESLLFGHKRGAFSGAAASQQGAFDTADGGTLVLDEVAEMGGAVQAKMLRAVQFREIQRIGDTVPHNVDVQLVVTTHQDLAALVKDGGFREDLYWRLAGFRIDLEPLRRRQLDVGPLLSHFLEEYGAPTLDDLVAARRSVAYHLATLLERALLHPWPGNARELRDEARHLGRMMQMRMASDPSAPLPPLEEAFSRRMLRAKLRDSGGMHRKPDSHRLPMDADAVRGLFRDVSALRAAIDEHADGNVRRFSDLAAAVLEARPDAVRRRIYRSMGGA